MPDWWEELVVIPNVTDNHCRLAQKVQASFEIPQVRCKAVKVINDYSLPPAPKCVGRKAFLLIPDPRMPCQDYREEQPWKTLAYVQALQYLAEKANLPKPDDLHAFWQDVFTSWDGPWSLLPPLLMEPSIRGTTPRLGISGGRGYWTKHDSRPHKPLCWQGDLLHHQRSQPLHQLRSQMSWLLLLESQLLSWPGGWLPHLPHWRQTRRWGSPHHINSLVGHKYIHLAQWPQWGESL